MTLEMLAAKSGDCLILRCGTAAKPALILIDGGPSGVWKESLKPRLMEIRAEQKLTDGQALVIDLLVISHVDDDHINGVIGLLEFIHDRKLNKQPPLFRIKRIWHNSFDNILGNDETTKAPRSQFGLASLGSDIEAGLRNHEAGAPRDLQFIFASIKQGDDVRRLAGALDIPLNPDFGGRLVQGEGGGIAKPINVGGVELIVVGPLQDELVALQRAHDEWLRLHPERLADATELLAALDDEAVANLSSIVLLARHNGKTLLLTGDARADLVLEGLEKIGAVDKGGAFSVDILKMPHHGSIRNIDANTIARLPASQYAFSGNGRFGNPDRETFDLLFAMRPGAPMTMVLSYKLEDLDRQRERDWEKKREKDPNLPAWNPAKDALTAVLSTPPSGTTVTQSPGKFVVIDF
ncbi:MAG: hypothetical protein BVN33_04105 [Proteobacteria bacterium ST_bin13]|nr:MAG: hypothetical protein BVN33_04105 [Proteobacteria bacterium ST_bin13]